MAAMTKRTATEQLYAQHVLGLSQPRTGTGVPIVRERRHRPPTHCSSASGSTSDRFYSVYVLWRGALSRFLNV